MDNGELKAIRWKQRYENLSLACSLLGEAAEIPALNRLEEEGMIRRFEYTWELAWNTLKDYLESEGIVVRFPREAIKESFAAGLLDDGEIWMEMIGARNLVAHRYDEGAFLALVTTIRSRYYPALRAMVARFGSFS